MYVQIHLSFPHQEKCFCPNDKDNIPHGPMCIHGIPFRSDPVLQKPSSRALPSGVWLTATLARQRVLGVAACEVHCTQKAVDLSSIYPLSHIALFSPLSLLSPTSSQSERELPLSQSLEKGGSESGCWDGRVWLGRAVKQKDVGGCWVGPTPLGRHQGYEARKSLS